MNSGELVPFICAWGKKQRFQIRVYRRARARTHTHRETEKGRLLVRFELIAVAEIVAPIRRLNSGRLDVYKIQRLAKHFFVK